MMDDDKAIRAAKLTLGAVLDKQRARTAKDRAGGQIVPSKYLPNVPRQAHAAGGKVADPRVSFLAGNHPEVSPVVYHATKADFHEFRPLSHFGTQRAAHDRYHAGTWNNGKVIDSTAGVSVMPVHISLKNPLDVGPERDWQSNRDTLRQAADAMFKSGRLDQDYLKAAEKLYDLADDPRWGSDPRQAEQEGANLLRQAGHDGIIYTNRIEDPGSRSFVTLGPEQVKSAIGNRGTFDPTHPNMTFADGGEVDLPAPVDLGQVREQKQLQGFHQNLMNDINTRMSATQAAYQKAVDAGHFDGYDVGTVLQGKNSPLKITGHFMQRWKPNSVTLNHFDRLGAKPSIIEHEGQQYIPMLRYTSGSDAGEDNQEGTLYLDAVKATGYPKMGVLRSVKARGGADGGYVPQKTVKAYKLFRTKGDGKLYPLFVHADKPVEMGKWLEAEAGPQGKAQGKVKSKLGDLAYRPGWHAGDLPIATHIGGKSDPSLKKPDYRPDNHVWAEVEMADDHDWQSEANARGKGVKAAITDQVPLKGFYRFKTNPNMTGNWLIGGHMKVNRVLSDDDVKAINDAAGTADLPRLQRADGGSVAERSPMFEGMSEHLLDDEGKPMELWHGTPSQPFEAFDDSKIGVRDPGFFGRGHYLTPDRGVAEGYADPDEMGRGSVMGPMHAALKNPYVWDVSDDNKAHSTLRDLQSMGIMKGQDRMEPWDNLQRHHIDPFMAEMKRRGHDGVIYKTGQGVKEIVVFNPNMIKHRDAEVGDPNDPRIMRAKGGMVERALTITQRAR